MHKCKDMKSFRILLFVHSLLLTLCPGVTILYTAYRVSVHASLHIHAPTPAAPVASRVGKVRGDHGGRTVAATEMLSHSTARVTSVARTRTRGPCCSCARFECTRSTYHNIKVLLSLLLTSTTVLGVRRPCLRPPVLDCILGVEGGHVFVQQLLGALALVGGVAIRLRLRLNLAANATANANAV